MPEYRDYGAVGNTTAPLVEVDNIRRSQVYQATHDGDQRLSFMQRSFISFSYGEKLIEDFNLLAIIENNALQRNLYADFEDNTTDSDVWDGQIYWNSHFKANELSFTLFTDGITEKQLDEFKNYFQPGKIDELVLSEHPNRAIMARVSETPEFSMLPFEEKTKVKIAGKEYDTSTTSYKGRINLKFAMDDPFWYSRANLLDRVDDDIVNGFWINANGNRVHLLSDKDALKVMLEDGVPCSEMLYDLSESYMSVINNVSTSYTESAHTDSTRLPQSILIGDSFTPIIDTSNSTTGSLVGYAEADWGYCAYAILNNSTGLSFVDSSHPIYFYYAGTAPCRPILTFALVPTIRDEQQNTELNGYINFPKNEFVDEENPYNTITIECTEKQTFSFTTPSVLTGFNQAIKVFKSSNMINASWEEVRNTIRETVKHWAPRQYACHVIDSVCGNTIITTSALLSQCVSNMGNFIKDNENNVRPIYFTINCKNGVSTGYFVYRNKFEQENSLLENVGDMVQSDYLVIKEKNVFDEDGYISAWTEGKKYCHKLYADCQLSNIKLYYKYLYL